VVRVSATVAWALVAGLVLGIGFWMIASATPRMSRPRLARRVAPYVIDISAGARDSLAPASPGPLPVFGMLLAPLVQPVQRALDSALGGSSIIARRLRQSGSTATVGDFRSQQVLFSLAGAALGVGAGFAFAQVRPMPFAAQAALPVVLAVIGIVARDQWLARAARARLRRLSDELPVVLEFLTLSLSAGEGVLDAMRRVARVSAGELSAELARVVAAVNTGLPLADTLSALARDLELPALTRCVEQVVGALDRGSPLAEVLRAQAQDARDEAKRELLEVAGKKEVAMLVPLVFLILPVTIAFAIFPGIFVLQVGF
jgi:tight adherence protein C